MNYKVIEGYITKHFNRFPRVPESYYSRVTDWMAWYSGYVKEFHEVHRSNGDRTLSSKMRKLGMAERVSHDWSSILVNEGLDISVISSSSKCTEKTNLFIKGKRGTTGVLGSQNFNANLSLLVEKAYALGTGAIAINLTNISVADDGTILDAKDGRIEFNYLDCFNIIPLGSCNGTLREVCFVSEVRKQDTNYIFYQLHELVDGKYVIHNCISDISGADVNLAEFGLVKTIKTGSPNPWFTIIKPAKVDTQDLSNPMGVSIFSNAIDAIKNCDEAYHYLSTEVKSGSRLVFMDRSLFKLSADGNSVVVPQDEQQPFIKLIGSEMNNNSEGLVKEVTPKLRVDQYIANLQESLNLLSLKCGLGAKYYEFNSGTVVTATQYSGSKQDLRANRAKNGLLLKSAIEGLISSVIWIGCHILCIDGVSDKSRVEVTLFDSIQEDDGTLRERDRVDVSNGLMQPWEYRVKWYKESEEQAKTALGIKTDI